MTIDAKILHILQHSLGLDQYGMGRPYRNYFCTGAESVDHPICMESSRRGLMSPPRPGGKLYGDMDFFFVTDLGKSYVKENSPPAPVISRSKRRYAKFLAIDGSMSFHEFLSSPYSRI